MRRSGRLPWRALPAILWAALAGAAAPPAAGGPVAPPRQEIALGLFIPVRGPDRDAGEEARRGAALAVARANRDGGVRGRRLRIAVAPSDVPWEGASRELVTLIYRDGAAAVVGALDGRTAHLAEQVITRARGDAVFITPWASETTLTQIKIPWFFRAVPDDRRQAAVLVQEIFAARGLRRIAALVDPAFDGSAAAEAFERQAPPGAVGRAAAVDPGACARLRSEAARGSIEGVVLFAPPRAAAACAAALRGVALFGPLALASPGFLDAPGSAADGTVLVAPAAAESGPARDFARAYESAHGRSPTPLAAAAHDAAAALIAGLRATGGATGDRLAEEVARVRFEGATGLVRFDGSGGRAADPGLAVVRGGRLRSPADGAMADGFPRERGR